MNRSPLAGRRIVVTRPREQAAALAARIRDAGGEPIVFPAIEIRDAPDPGAVLALLGRLEEFDLAIFVSPTAVRKGLELVRTKRAGKSWPARVRLAAIGRGSGWALEREGFSAVIAPQEQAGSEALLAMPEFARVGGRRVLIFRGDGGRELLGDTLAARGAHVEYAECYRRERPAADSAPLLAAWERGAVDAVTVSSAEGLANLVGMLDEPGRERLAKTPLFVPHRRVAEAAQRLGVHEAIVAGPGDGDVVERLVAYFSGKS